MRVRVGVRGQGLGLGVRVRVTELADEVEESEAFRLLIGLALGDGQRVACAVEVAEGAAQPTRVALPPVDDVEAWM